MKLSPYQQKKKDDEKKKAVALYEQGFSTRAVSLLLKKMGIRRSHTWVAEMVRTEGQGSLP